MIRMITKLDFCWPKLGLKNLLKQWPTACPMSRNSTCHLAWLKKKFTGCTRKIWKPFTKIVNVLGYTQFRNMWREHFQHVLIPEVCCNWYYWTKSRLENEVWPNFAAFSITYFKPVLIARNERVEFMNVAFALHISGKLIPEVWYMHNYKRAHPQT